MTGYRKLAIPVVALSAALLAPVPAQAQVYGDRSWPQAPRDSHRALGRDLNLSVQSALQTFEDEASGDWQDDQIEAWMRDFARSAQMYRNGVSSSTSRDLPVLQRQARRIANRLDRAGYDATAREWSRTTSTLTRMAASVERSRPGLGTGGWASVAEMNEFRRLARDLDVSASRVQALADRSARDYRQNDRFISEVRDFTDRARNVSARMESGRIDREDLGQVVNGLLREGRQAERRMRDANVYRATWSEWSRTVQILERMDSIAR